MKYFSKIYIAVVFMLLYIPILVLMLFSFNKTSNTGAFDGFSLSARLSLPPSSALQLRSAWLR